MLSNGAICFAKFYKFNEILNFCPFFTLAFLGLKKLTDSTFVFKHIYTDTCSVIVEGCQKLHELVFVFHQDFLNWWRFIWVCNKHLKNKYHSKGNSLQMQTYFQSSQKLICLRLQAIGKVTFNVPLPTAFSQVNLNPWISKSTPQNYASANSITTFTIIGEGPT